MVFLRWWWTLQWPHGPMGSRRKFHMADRKFPGRMGVSMGKNSFKWGISTFFLIYKKGNTLIDGHSNLLRPCPKFKASFSTFCSRSPSTVSGPPRSPQAHSKALGMGGLGCQIATVMREPASLPLGVGLFGNVAVIGSWVVSLPQQRGTWAARQTGHRDRHDF